MRVKYEALNWQRIHVLLLRIRRISLLFAPAVWNVRGVILASKAGTSAAIYENSSVTTFKPIVRIVTRHFGSSFDWVTPRRQSLASTTIRQATRDQPLKGQSSEESCWYYQVCCEYYWDRINLFRKHCRDIRLWRVRKAHISAFVVKLSCFDHLS